MASIHRQVLIGARPEDVWGALRDVGAIHRRLAPGGSRFVWIADLLPHELAPTIGAMIDQGLAVIKRTLERRETGA